MKMERVVRTHSGIYALELVQDRQQRMVNERLWEKASREGLDIRWRWVMVGCDRSACMNRSTAMRELGTQHA